MNNFFKIAVLKNINRPINIYNTKIDNLEDYEVLVKIFYSFICGTQLNEWLGKKGEDKFLPHTLGHEASGKIIKKGKNVKKFKIGDFVIISWIPNKLKYISIKKTYKTAEGKIINSGPISTFSEYSVVPQNRIYKINKRIDMKISALYGCAMPTGYGLALQTKKLGTKKNSQILIYGLGGVGLICAASLKYLGYNNLILIDKSKKNLNFGKHLNVDNLMIFNSKKYHNFFKNNKVDIAIDCSGNINAIQDGYNKIKLSGSLIIAGNVNKGKKFKIDPYDIIFGKKILGSIGGNLNIEGNIKNFEKVVKKNKTLFNVLISKKYKLKFINNAIQDFKMRKNLRPLLEINARN